MKRNSAARTATLALVIALLMMATLFSGERAKANSFARYGQALYYNQTLYGGQSLVNGNYTLAMQTDGNVVIYYKNSTAIWTLGLYAPGSRLVFQGDSNLVVYRPDNSVVWASGQQGAAQFIMQSDGNFVGYTSSGSARWQSYTSTSGISSATAFGTPPDANISWFYNGAAFNNNYAFEERATWAMATLGWTDFNTSRTQYSVYADVYITRYKIDNAYAALTGCRYNAQNTVTGVCPQFEVTINSGVGYADVEALFCHEYGHTVRINDVGGGDINPTYLPVEKSCLRSKQTTYPETRSYGFRHLEIINSLF